MDILKNCQWYRLCLTLVNINTSPAMSSHPFVIIQAIIKGVNSLLSGDEPIIFFHIKGKKHTYKMHQFDKLPIEVFFFKKSPEYYNQWKKTFISYLFDPITGRNFDILEIGEIENRSFDNLLLDIGEIHSEGEICLEFLSPFPFKPQKSKQRTYISKEEFIKVYENRFFRLFGKEIHYTSKKDDFTLLPYYWNYTEIRHPSMSQIGHTQYINGCIGKLYIKGVFKDFLPFLILGSELHTGAKISFSQGYYVLHNNSVPFFDSFFPNKKSIIDTIKITMERYNNAITNLSETEGFSFNEETYAEKIYEEIKENTYTPSPNRSFYIKKKDGSKRLIEQPCFKDLIVQEYLLRTISGVFDRIFEASSIGFRKGKSREIALDMLRSAVSEGYQYAVEADIEDFFLSIDLEILTALLDFYIPQKDIILKSVLLKSIKNGYIVGERYFPRVKGLAQGSPLSPVLANLYLYSFNEKIQNSNVKMVRYGDDFIILTKTKEDARNILSQAENFLSGPGLRIKKGGKMKKLLVISNHSPETWSEEQKKGWEQIDFIPFPDVNPYLSLDEVSNKVAREIIEKIRCWLSKNPDGKVCLQGDFSLCYIIFKNIQENIFTFPTTTRNVVVDKDGKRTYEFKFGRWR
ncbi:MAG TPA: reverse transcriptase domain-containing protein [bacterium]|nr:reverse transcriptase domain-containing protein [bacterium]